MALQGEQLVRSKPWLYPGEGVVAIPEILARLREKGYREQYATELFQGKLLVFRTA